MRRYGIIIGVEFGVAAVGAAVIALRGRGEYITAWVCRVVGVHFWPMAPVLKARPWWRWAALLTGVAVGAALVSRTTAVATSAIPGAGSGPAPSRLRQLGCGVGHRVGRASRNCDYGVEPAPPVSSAGQTMTAAVRCAHPEGTGTTIVVRMLIGGTDQRYRPRLPAQSTQARFLPAWSSYLVLR